MQIYFRGNPFLFMFGFFQPLDKKILRKIIPCQTFFDCAKVREFSPPQCIYCKIKENTNSRQIVGDIINFRPRIKKVVEHYQFFFFFTIDLDSRKLLKIINFFEFYFFRHTKTQSLRHYFKIFLIKIQRVPLPHLTNRPWCTHLEGKSLHVYCTRSWDF